MRLIISTHGSTDLPVIKYGTCIQPQTNTLSAASWCEQCHRLPNQSLPKGMIHSDKPTVGRAQVCVQAAAGGQLSATYFTSVHYALLGSSRLHFCLKIASVPVKAFLKVMAKTYKEEISNRTHKPHHKIYSNVLLSWKHFNMKQVGAFCKAGIHCRYFLFRTNITSKKITET